MSVVDQVKAARRVSVPILAINTPDQAATVTAVVEGVNGNTPKVQWDFVRGFKPLNEEGAMAIAGLGDEAEEAVANPTGAIKLAGGFPERVILFIHNAQRFLDDGGFVQAVCNLRDMFKKDHRTLILLSHKATLPTELSGDVIVLDEPLPCPEDIERIIRDVHASANIEVTDDTVAKAVSATTEKEIQSTCRPYCLNDASVSLPPSRNPTMTRVMIAISRNHASPRSGRRPVTPGPIRNPKMISSVTRGRRVRFPSVSVRRPTSSNAPSVIRTCPI